MDTVIYPLAEIKIVVDGQTFTVHVDAAVANKQPVSVLVRRDVPELRLELAVADKLPVSLLLGDVPELVGTAGVQGPGPGKDAARKAMVTRSFAVMQQTWSKKMGEMTARVEVHHVVNKPPWRRVQSYKPYWGISCKPHQAQQVQLSSEHRLGQSDNQHTGCNMPTERW